LFYQGTLGPIHLNLFKPIHDLVGGVRFVQDGRPGPRHLIIVRWRVDQDDMRNVAVVEFASELPACSSHEIAGEDYGFGCVSAVDEFANFIHAACGDDDLCASPLESWSEVKYLERIAVRQYDVCLHGHLFYLSAERTVMRVV
jgi:hypothetical protein